MLSNLLWKLTIPGRYRLARWLLSSRWYQSAQTLKTADGLTLSMPCVKESIAYEIYAFGRCEPKTIDALLQLLPARGVLVDVGANIGAIALTIAKLRPDAHVIAIEADPKIASYLSKNAEQNQIANVTIYNCLVGSKDGVADFYPAPDAKFGMGAMTAQFGATPITLPQRSLLSLLTEHQHQRVDVIKVDVEGAELAVFHGAQEMLQSATAPTVIFEYCEWAERRMPGQNAGDAMRFLQALGYQVTTLDQERIIDSQKLSQQTMLRAMPKR